MKYLTWVLLLAGVAVTCYGQVKVRATFPFTVTWTDGTCRRCKIATALGHVQFVSRKEAWAVGFHYGEQGAGDFIVVHTTDAGRTWTELPQTYQHAGDADGPPAFSFLDQRRGWVAWWNPADEPKIIETRDGGEHWKQLSDTFLQKVLFFDDRHGCGSEVNHFLCTDDGGNRWMQTEVPQIRFIDRMFFLTPEVGWIAGSDGRDFLVFRTVDGGRNWGESRTRAPDKVAVVRDLIFLDQNRGWLITWHYNDGGTYLFATRDGGKTWALEPNLPFQGKGNWASVVRFVSDNDGLVFADGAQNSKVMYSSDGGAHWNSEPLPHPVYDCQTVEGDLLCSSNSGFRLLFLRRK